MANDSPSGPAPPGQVAPAQPGPGTLGASPGVGPVHRQTLPPSRPGGDKDDDGAWASGAGMIYNQAAEAGAVIVPPVPAFYARPATLDGMVDHIVNRTLDQIGLDLPSTTRRTGRPIRRDGDEGAESSAAPRDRPWTRTTGGAGSVG